MYDLDNPQDLKDIAKRVKDDIDNYAQVKYDKGHRNHLGASEIGHPCGRKAWYTFRWIYHHIRDGRMRRLLERGNLEELRNFEYLRGIGFKVYDHNAYISDCDGHFGGSPDAEIEFPEFYGIAGRFLNEDKTKGTGNGFNKLVENGVKITSEEYWGQQCVYGFKRGLSHSLFMSTNKNDDDLHIEFIKLDWSHAEDLIRKAAVIIKSPEPPNQYSKNSTNYVCKMCDYHAHCHLNKPIEKNCRSCKNCSPIQDALWACSLYGSPIPDNIIKIGCDSYVPIV